MDDATLMRVMGGKIVELRVFGGLSVEETAEVLEVSPATVMRDWCVAKAWLVRELGRGESTEGPTMAPLGSMKTGKCRH